MRWLLVVAVAVLAFVGLATALERLGRVPEADEREELPHRTRKAGGA